MRIGTADLSEKIMIIAEMSANHGNDLNQAKRTIEAAKKAGADAIKLQTYTPDTMTIDCENEYFRINQNTIWDGKSLYELYSEAHLPWEWHQELMVYADEIGIICFSSPFDQTAVDFLEEIKVPAYKVASFEMVDLPLIRYIARKGKPILLSTGIATLNEIEEAVNACREEGNNQIILLLCTSEYPAKIEDANLVRLRHLKETHQVVVGISDHTLENTVPMVAAALGARVIEKHFTIDKGNGSADAAFSLDEREFSEMVKTVREAEMSLGTVDYQLTSNKKKSRELARSLFVVKDIKAGDLFTIENVRSIRPGFGLAPKYLESIINKKAKTAIRRGTPLTLEHL